MNQSNSKSPFERDPVRVSLVTTVLNDARGCAALLNSLKDQTRRPDEVIVVDGGSTDDTVDVIREAARREPCIRLIEAPGANIGQGRNLGIAAATGEVIVSTDTGCRLDPRWTEEIVRPFEDDPEMEFVAGFYRIDPHSLLEAVVGTATMRGALGPVNAETFNPSCRSMAYTKKLWECAGGLPDWMEIDDNLFNHKLRRMRVKRCFAEQAVVYWRPRSTLRAIYRQFRFYASHTGETQMDTEPTFYNLRNLGFCGLLLVGGFIFQPVWILLGVALTYFYVYAFHNKSRRVAAKLDNWHAYPLSLLVHWTIILGDAVGYLKSSIQHRRKRSWYRQKLADYLAPA